MNFIEVLIVQVLQSLRWFPMERLNLAIRVLNEEVLDCSVVPIPGSQIRGFFKGH